MRLAAHLVPAPASTAAGQRLGVAPGAAIVPIATNLTEDQQDEYLVAAELLSLVVSLPTGERTRFDQLLAAELRDEYAKFDIINRSFGSTAPPDPAVDSLEVAEADRFLARTLPSARRALYQLDRTPGERTILVYAAGNEGHERPNATAARPYYLRDARGHHVVVVATLSPVGALTAGQEQRAFAHTSLQTPGAFGSVADRLGDTELATFDAQGFPFWMPVSGLVASRATARSPIPEVSAPSEAPPAAGLEALGMH